MTRVSLPCADVCFCGVKWERKMGTEAPRALGVAVLFAVADASVVVVKDEGRLTQFLSLWWLLLSFLVAGEPVPLSRR